MEKMPGIVGHTKIDEIICHFQKFSDYKGFKTATRRNKMSYGSYIQHTTISSAEKQAKRNANHYKKRSS